MSLLPIDLQKLPPQALDVIRYLSVHDNKGTVSEIMAGTGLTARGFRKAIRRLVTRYYVDMPQQDFYTLTATGKQAAEDIEMYDGTTVPLVVPIRETESPAGTARHARQLSMLVPKEFVIRKTIILRAGFDAPAANEPVPLQKPGRVILRLSAPGCDVTPVERPLEVEAADPAGPVSFRVTPRREGPVRLKIEAYQLLTQKELRPVGGMFFDLNVAGFPTPDSAEVKALGAVMRLYAR